MIFAALVFLERQVVRNTSAYTYKETETAYMDKQYFSTLEKAKAFAQQYCPLPLEWRDLGNGYTVAEYGEFNCNIEIEKYSHFDTTSTPALPTKFHVAKDY